MLRATLAFLAQQAVGGAELPWWTTVVVTPTFVLGLLVTRVLRTGKEMDNAVEKAEARATAAEAREVVRVAAAEERANKATDLAEKAADRERSTMAQALPALETSNRTIERLLTSPVGRTTP